ncbi:SDR family NAD(P)-dependent oxidoreductase [Desulfobulbus rhabdoformis]|uniref:SDR family NAD(P)-dependent oxidoreductase n=1 Tax=Desulfobulbus rhabdoformis TaxID=34032 RepID=UPI00196409D2|nr:SDR family NAD(P)-dependent oxidoreductase [Desulfobulbus rhabdoformis]MBM9616565.1 SDR family NAD(P)-dependent oxidoreductase [Desulfobulbus rhabdoformis]
MKKTVLVTGANRGIGLATAELLGQHGYRVVLGVRALQAGEDIANRMCQKGFDVLALPIDLENKALLDQSLEELSRRNLPIDGLINNAGVLDEIPLLQLSQVQIDACIAAHLTGPLHLIQALAPSMIARGYGRIVNVSSNWGSFAEGMGGPGLYGVTKAALNALTVRLAKELPATVKVNAMCPGWVRTRMSNFQGTLSPEQAAENAFWLATLPEDGPTGGFFQNRRPLQW